MVIIVLFVESTDLSSKRIYLWTITIKPVKSEACSATDAINFASEDRV